jgi:hypothetical protein
VHRVAPDSAEVKLHNQAQNEDATTEQLQMFSQAVVQSLICKPRRVVSSQQQQIQAKIAQLELDQAGDKEQEPEIGEYPLAASWASEVQPPPATYRPIRPCQLWSRTH